jgi:hypothetical protein
MLYPSMLIIKMSASDKANAGNPAMRAMHSDRSAKYCPNSLQLQTQEAIKGRTLSIGAILHNSSANKFDSLPIRQHRMRLPQEMTRERRVACVDDPAFSTTFSHNELMI